MIRREFRRLNSHLKYFPFTVMDIFENKSKIKNPQLQEKANLILELIYPRIRNNLPTNLFSDHFSTRISMHWLLVKAMSHQSSHQFSETLKD